MIYARVAARAYIIFAACARFWIFCQNTDCKTAGQRGCRKTGAHKCEILHAKTAPDGGPITAGTAGRDRRSIFKLFVQNPIRMAMHVAIRHMHCHASIFTYHR